MLIWCKFNLDFNKEINMKLKLNKKSMKKLTKPSQELTPNQTPQIGGGASIQECYTGYFGTYWPTCVVGK
jgi:uncharacterized protein involved in tolerance to divalent cations